MVKCYTCDVELKDGEGRFLESDGKIIFAICINCHDNYVLFLRKHIEEKLKKTGSK